MKLSTADISRFLSNPPTACRGVLVYGPDGGLVRERMQTLTKHFVPDADPFRLVDVTEAQISDDPAILADELNAMSFSGGLKLVRLPHAGEKTAKAIAAGCTAGVANILLVSAGELTPKSALRALFEKEPHLAALPCYRDEARTLEPLIRQHLQQAGVQAEPDALRYLAEALGNDRGVTQQELEKITLYKWGDDAPLSLAEARALTGGNDDVSQDDLCHALAVRDRAGVDETLHRLLREGVSPVALIRAAVRYLTRVQAVITNQENGLSGDQLFQGLYPAVFFKEAPVLRKAMQSWSRAGLDGAFARLMQAERDVKSSLMPQELAISRALLALARG